MLLHGKASATVPKQLLVVRTHLLPQVHHSRAVVKPDGERKKASERERERKGDIESAAKQHR